jgi:hypothetical protein
VENRSTPLRDGRLLSKGRTTHGEQQMCQTMQADVMSERPPGDVRPRRDLPAWVPKLRRALDILGTAGGVLLHEPPPPKKRR